MCCSSDEKIHKEGESIKILTILDFINNMNE